MSLCILPSIDIFHPVNDDFLDVFDTMEDDLASIEEDLVALHCDELEHTMLAFPEEVEDNESQVTLSLNISGFEPEELNVNLDGRTLTIEGKQEIEVDKGYSMRSFTRQWELPEDVDVEQIRSSITEEGRLVVEAPKLAQLAATGRDIPIQKAVHEK